MRVGLAHERPIAAGGVRAPLRLRVENQLGYKMVKWIERIEFIRSEKELGKGEGGKNEDDEFFDLLPNI
jgi:sulfoxide reductase catalytic subunit YedY